MDLSVQIFSVTQAQSNSGGLTETRSSRGTFSATLGAPANEGEREIAKRVATAASWWLTLPFGTTVQKLDQVLISGQYYQVIYVPPVNSFQTALRVLVTEVAK